MMSDFFISIPCDHDPLSLIIVLNFGFVSHLGSIESSSDEIILFVSLMIDELPKSAESAFQVLALTYLLQLAMAVILTLMSNGIRFNKTFRADVGVIATRWASEINKHLSLSLSDFIL